MLCNLLLTFLLISSSVVSAADDDDSAAVTQDPVALRCAQIRVVFSEMKAIAEARADYNRGWLKFLTEGKFSDADTEVEADERKRFNFYVSNFFSKNRALSIVEATKNKDIAGLMPLNLSRLDTDSKRMCRFAKFLDIFGKSTDDQLQDSVDKLFIFFHFSWFFQDGESSKNLEVSEKYWISVLKNKLRPFVSHSAKLLAEFFKKLIAE